LKDILEREREREREREKERERERENEMLKFENSQRRIAVFRTHECANHSLALIVVVADLQLLQNSVLEVLQRRLI
jgi:hypothetical protein